jgi:hypothetical protein
MIEKAICVAGMITAILLASVFAFYETTRNEDRTSDYSRRLSNKFIPVTEWVCSYPGQGQFCKSPIDVALVCYLEDDNLCEYLTRVAGTDQRLQIVGGERIEEAEVILRVSYMHDDDRRDPGLLVINAKSLSDIGVDTADRLASRKENISNEMSILFRSTRYKKSK